MTVGVNISSMSQVAYNQLYNHAIHQQLGLQSQYGNSQLVQYANAVQRSDPEPHPPLQRETKWGEIVAYRCWSLHGGLLRSYSAQYLWMPGAIEGLQEGQRIEDYGSAGIHAFKDLRNAALYANPENSVVGSVKLWGDIVEYERGYHAEFAKIVSLDHILCSGTGGSVLLAELRERYGVQPAPIKGNR